MQESLLVAVHRATGLKLHVSQKKLGIIRCLELPGEAAAAAASVLLFPGGCRAPEG